MGVGEIKGKEGGRWRREMGVEPHHYIYLIKIIPLSISLKYKIGSNLLLLPKYMFKINTQDWSQPLVISKYRMVEPKYV